MDTAHTVTRSEVEGIVEAQLREHERRCSNDRHELERRLDKRLDAVERKIAYWCGGLAVGSVLLQIGMRFL